MMLTTDSVNIFYIRFVSIHGVLKNIPVRPVGAVAISIENWVDPKYSVAPVVQLSLIGTSMVLIIYFFGILPCHIPNKTKSRFITDAGTYPLGS